MSGDDDILTITEAAADARFSYGSLWSLISRGGGPRTVLIGRRQFVKRSDLRNWMQAQEQQPRGGVSSNVS